MRQKTISVSSDFRRGLAPVGITTGRLLASMHHLAVGGAAAGRGPRCNAGELWTDEDELLTRIF